MKDIYNKKIWHQLHNRYWLKVQFTRTNKYHKDYEVSIVVGKTRRIVNDHFMKTTKSPKVSINKSTNYNGGLEALRLTLQDIQDYAKILPQGYCILVQGSDQQRTNVYS
jgi:hypothetical protein